MIEATDWLQRCSDRLRALAQGAALDGIDSDEIAKDLFEILHNLAPEWAAEAYVGTR